MGSPSRIFHYRCNFVTYSTKKKTEEEVKRRIIKYYIMHYRMHYLVCCFQKEVFLVINSQIGKEYHLHLFLFNLLIPFLILSILFISVCTTVTLVISSQEVLVGPLFRVWDLLLKKQPYNDHFSYVSSDTMHNITYNVHSSITQYIMRSKLA